MLDVTNSYLTVSDGKEVDTHGWLRAGASGTNELTLGRKNNDHMLTWKTEFCVLPINFPVLSRCEGL